MIEHPTTPMTPEQRAHQMWSVHPNDLERLGFDKELADKSNISTPHHASGRADFGARALFYLAHIMAAIDDAVVPLPETDNTMNMLRQFALAHRNGEPIRLTEEDSIKLSEAILATLSSLDSFWETVNGRKLTDEEKGLA